MKRGRGGPPPLTRVVAELLLRGDRGEVILGDLEEDYRERIARGASRMSASWRYRRHVWASAAAVIRNGVQDRRGRGQGPAANTAAATRSPLRTGGDGMWSLILQDARLAVRALARRPGFTAVVILTVALGIGATTAIFSVVHGVLLRPLPYPDADRIVAVAEGSVDGRFSRIQASYPNYLAWAEQTTSIDRWTVIRTGTVTVTGSDDAARIFARYATPEYLEILDARPVLGRILESSDNVAPGGHPVAVISNDLWQTRFGGDDRVVGRTIGLGGTPYTVIGVLSADFREPFGAGLNASVDLWLPAMMAGPGDPRGDAVFTERRARIWSVMGTLAPGATLEQANGELRAIAARLTEEFPDVNRGFVPAAEPLNTALTLGLRGPVMILLVGAAVLLLIGCFNVANLMLARGATRQQALALQLALGAGRAALIRYLTVESLVLALAGGALGVLAAWVALPTLLQMSPTALPPLANVAVDWPVLLAASGFTVAAGVLFGVLPALRVSAVDLRTPLAGSARHGADRSSARLRSGLVTFEIATATILLTASAVLLSTFRDIRNTDPGFETERLLTMGLSLPAAKYPTTDEMVAAITGVRDRVEAVPGVEWAVTWGPGRPGQSFNFQSSVPEGMVVERLGDSPIGRRHHLGPGGLTKMGIGIVQGREFLASDRSDAQSVVIVSQTLANELWPGQDPIGQTLRPFIPPGADAAAYPRWSVVGVAADAEHGGRLAPAPGLFTTPHDVYFPMAQRAEPAFTLLVRTAGDPALGPLREAIRTVDPDIPVFNVSTMSEHFVREEEPARFAALLMATFAAAALLLAALGVYGVLSFTVSERTREIGLRAALGARREVTLKHFVAMGVRMAVLGVLLGTVVGFGLDRVLPLVIGDVSGVDPWAVLVSCAALLIVAVTACAIPALRATRVPPIVALRE